MDVVRCSVYFFLLCILLAKGDEDDGWTARSDGKKGCHNSESSAECEKRLSGAGAQRSGLSRILSEQLQKMSSRLDSLQQQYNDLHQQYQLMKISNTKFNETVTEIKQQVVESYQISNRINILFPDVQYQSSLARQSASKAQETASNVEAVVTQMQDTLSSVETQSNLSYHWIVTFKEVLPDLRGNATQAYGWYVQVQQQLPNVQKQASQAEQWLSNIQKTLPDVQEKVTVAYEWTVQTKALLPMMQEEIELVQNWTDKWQDRCRCVTVVEF